MDWDIVIGLETHVQLLTKSKIFSRGGTQFGQTANTEIDFVDLGLPGVLPVVNKKALSQLSYLEFRSREKFLKRQCFLEKTIFIQIFQKGIRLAS